MTLYRSISPSAYLPPRRTSHVATRSRKPYLKPRSPLAQRLVTAPRAATLRSRPCEAHQFGDCGRPQNDQDSVEGRPCHRYMPSNFSLRTWRILESLWPQQRQLCDIDWPTRRQRQHLATSMSLQGVTVVGVTVVRVNDTHCLPSILGERFGKQDEDMIGDSGLVNASVMP